MQQSDRINSQRCNFLGFGTLKNSQISHRQHRSYRSSIFSYFLTGVNLNTWLQARIGNITWPAVSRGVIFQGKADIGLQYWLGFYCPGFAWIERVLCRLHSYWWYFGGNGRKVEWLPWCDVFNTIRERLTQYVSYNNKFIVILLRIYYILCVKSLRLFHFAGHSVLCEKRFSIKINNWHFDQASSQFYDKDRFDLKNGVPICCEGCSGHW